MVFFSSFEMALGKVSHASPGMGEEDELGLCGSPISVHAVLELDYADPPYFEG